MNFRSISEWLRCKGFNVMNHEEVIKKIVDKYMNIISASTQRIVISRKTHDIEIYTVLDSSEKITFYSCVLINNELFDEYNSDSFEDIQDFYYDNVGRKLK